MPWSHDNRSFTEHSLITRGLYQAHLSGKAATECEHGGGFFICQLDPAIQSEHDERA
jgi:hypothetical protein